MANYFNVNRRNIQRAFENENYILPLANSDIPYEIVEHKNLSKSGKLKKVIVDNIPISPTSYTNSYVLFPEIGQKVFSRPENCKSVENIFLILSCNRLFVVLVEMKSLLELEGKDGLVIGIQNKIKHSISRTLLLFPNYLFDDTSHDNYPIEFHAIVVYNNENVLQQLEATKNFSSEPIVKIFNKTYPNNILAIDEPLGSHCKVRLHFCKNNGSPEEYSLNLNHIFHGDAEFANAYTSNRTLP